MPKGKGTYGSQVGRPPKKQKKYQAGGPVPPMGIEPNFPMPNEAMDEANKLGQELKSIDLEGIGEEYPMSNAMERSQIYREGGKVK